MPPDTPLIECVPNFSEGRRPAVITAIRDAIAADDSVRVLDVSSDHDHNRTVITFIGAPQAVADAALRGVAAAADRIDLRQHAGVHPRIGAADVVPLVPLRGISLAECARLARELGQRIAADLGLPVYLYEAAAQRPERANLAYVRRDPYEALVESIAADPDRAPDYGPTQLGPAGAVAVGARGPLIAFNAYLDTADVEVARQIAARIRASSGGLPHVKALGLLVDGRAQVSMNVIDFRQTGLHAIMGALRAEAARQGAQVVSTELVGLMPRAALLDAALASLQLPSDARALILEDRVGDQTGDYRTLPFE